jgi:hypothetical protein
MTHQWSPQAIEQAKAFNKQLLLTAVAVSIDELTPEQFKRLRLIVGEFGDGSTANNADNPHRWFHQEMKSIASTAMSAAHEAVMKLACSVDYDQP